MAVWCVLVATVGLVACGGAEPEPAGPGASGAPAADVSEAEGPDADQGPASPNGSTPLRSSAVPVEDRDVLFTVAREIVGYHEDVWRVAEGAGRPGSDEWDLPERVSELDSLLVRSRRALRETHGDRLTTDAVGDLVVGDVTLRPYFLTAGNVATGGPLRATAWGISTQLPFQLANPDGGPIPAPDEEHYGEPEHWVLFGWSARHQIAWAVTSSAPTLLWRRAGPVPRDGPELDELLGVLPLGGGRRRWVVHDAPSSWTPVR